MRSRVELTFLHVETVLLLGATCEISRQGYKLGFDGKTVPLIWLFSFVVSSGSLNRIPPNDAFDLLRCPRLYRVLSSPPRVP